MLCQCGLRADWSHRGIPNKCLKTWWPETELNRRRQPFQNSTEWPQFCDHSVTSTDVRLSVGFEAKHRQFDTRREPFVLEIAPIPDYFLFARHPGEALIGITFVSGNSLTLLNLHLGVRRELLLAIDSSLAGSLELIRFANFVEQGIAINRWINTETVLGICIEQTNSNIFLSKIGRAHV